MVKKLLLTAILIAGVLAIPAPMLAAGELDPEPSPDNEACATNLLNCYEAAAKVEGFWYRWAAGIDCELKFTKCVRQMVLAE